MNRTWYAAQYPCAEHAPGDHDNPAIITADGAPGEWTTFHRKLEDYGKLKALSGQ
jgi:hypothetical protein